MPFNPSTAHPVNSAFDPSTAKPVKVLPETGLMAGYTGTPTIAKHSPYAQNAAQIVLDNARGNAPLKVIPSAGFWSEVGSSIKGNAETAAAAIAQGALEKVAIYNKIGPTVPTAAIANITSSPVAGTTYAPASVVTHPTHNIQTSRLRTAVNSVERLRKKGEQNLSKSHSTIASILGAVLDPPAIAGNILGQGQKTYSDAIDKGDSGLKAQALASADIAGNIALFKGLGGKTSLSSVVRGFGAGAGGSIVNQLTDMPKGGMSVKQLIESGLTMGAINLIGHGFGRLAKGRLNAEVNPIIDLHQNDTGETGTQQNVTAPKAPLAITPEVPHAKTLNELMNAIPKGENAPKNPLDALIARQALGHPPPKGGSSLGDLMRKEIIKSKQDLTKSIKGTKATPVGKSALDKLLTKRNKPAPKVEHKILPSIVKAKTVTAPEVKPPVQEPTPKEVPMASKTETINPESTKPEVKIVSSPPKVESKVEPKSEVKATPKSEPLASLEEKNLIAMHNLTAENIKHADKLGGIPVPSIAISKVDEPHTGFGDITLLGNKDLVNPKNGAKVFGSDVYSGRSPDLVIKPGKDTVKKINSVLDPFRRTGDQGGFSLGNESVESLSSDPAFHRYMAKELNIPENKQGYDSQKSAAETMFVENGAKEKIFKGYTENGRRYSDYTLENIVKDMKKNIRGGEDIPISVKNLKAHVTPRFRSMREIKSESGKIDPAQANAVMEDAQSELLNLIGRLDRTRTGYGLNPLEGGEYAISDVPKMGVKRALIENGFKDVPEKLQSDIVDFVAKLKNTPSVYFEAKIPRAVQFSEFHTAVVPHNADKAAVEILKKSGVRIRRYKSDDEAERARVIKSAVNEKSGTLFAKGGSAEGISADTIRSEIPKHLRSAFKALEDKGILHIAENPEDLPEHVQAKMKAKGTFHSTQGFWDGKSLWLLGHNMKPGDALGTFLHEGSHATMKSMLGDSYGDLLHQYFNLLNKAGDPIARRAENRATDSGESGDRLDSERLAYLVQEAEKDKASSPKAYSLGRRILAAIKRTFLKSGLYKVAARAGIRINLKPSDFVALTEGAIKDFAKGKIEGAKFGPREVKREIQFSRRDKVLEDTSDLYRSLVNGGDAYQALDEIKTKGGDAADLGTAPLSDPAILKAPIEPVLGKVSEDYGSLTSGKDPVTGKIKDWLRELDDKIHAYFPHPKTEKAETTQGIIRSGLEAGTRHKGLVTRELYKMRPYFAKLTEEQDIEWRHRFELGDRSMPNAKKIQRILDQQFKDEFIAGFPTDYSSNYLYRLYKKRWSHPMYRGGKRVGGETARFEKQRAYEFGLDALKNGYRYKDKNLVDTLVRRIANGEIKRTRLSVLNSLNKWGMIRKAIEGDHAQFGESEFATKDFGKFYVPDDAVSMLNNGLFSKSVWNSDSLGAGIFQGWMRLKNPVVGSVLGGSLYHLTHEAVIMRSASGIGDVVETLQKAIKNGQLSPKLLIDFGKSLGLQTFGLGETTPNSLIRIRTALAGGIDGLPEMGKKIVTAAHIDMKLTSDEQTIAQLVMEGGLPLGLSKEYSSDVMRMMDNAFQDKKYAKGIMLAPFSALRAMQVPIMDWIVPNFKLIAYMDGARALVKAHPDFMTNYPLRVRELDKLTTRIEERFGQMSYDRLLWPKWIKETMQATFLSFTWNYGFFKQFGGGMIDLATTIPRAIDGGPIITSRTAYALSYTAMALGVGSLLGFAFTGKWPNSIIDMIYPPIGKKPDGSAERITTPFFTREFGGLWKHYDIEGVSGIAKMVLDKTSPVISLFAHQFENRTYMGKQIADPNASLAEQTWDRFKSAAEELTPISFQNRNGHLVMSVLGFNQAPGYATKPVLVNVIYAASSLYDQRTESKGQANKSDARRKGRKLYFAGEKVHDFSAYDVWLTDFVNKYHVSKAGVKDMVKGYYEPEGYYAFSQLPKEVQIHIFFTRMDDSQKLLYYRAMGRRIMEFMTPEQTKEVIALFKKSVTTK